MCVSVAGLGLEDVSGSGHHSQVLSLSQDTHKVSSLDLTVNLEQEAGSMSPMGSVNTSIGQVRVFLLMPFILQLMVSLGSPGRVRGGGKGGALLGAWSIIWFLYGLNHT